MPQRVRYTEAEKEWILAHADMSVEDEYEAFIKNFEKECSLSAFKTKRARLNNKGMSHARYTTEEDEWIIRHYSELGASETFKKLCERFGNRHGYQGFKTRCSELGLKVTEKRWREACLNNGARENVPIGTIQKRGRGQNWIKVGGGCEGWIPLTQYLLECPEGSIIIHLDGNKANDNLDNLRIVNRSISSRMSRWRMWSQNPIITETGIRCCELQDALIRSNNSNTMLSKSI